jgi:hypothetical protein
VQTRDAEGQFRFENHEQLGGGLIAQRGTALRLSNHEIDRLKTIVKGHMRPTQLARLEKKPISRDLYRYFRDLGESGIDIGILSLADLLAAYGPPIPQERWRNQLEVVKSLMAAWWENNERVVNPKTLLSGEDLLQEFNLHPGPIIGRLLELLREEQAEGKINTRAEALRFIKRQIALNDET